MLARNAICDVKSQMSAARIGIDVGGTSTDAIRHEADGRLDETTGATATTAALRDERRRA